MHLSGMRLLRRGSVVKQKLGEKQQALVDALRSGKYKQGTLTLRNSKDEFCCLGVACDLLDHIEWQADVCGSCYGVSDTKDMYLIGTLPRSVQSIYGFRSDNGSARDRNVLLNLTSLNDQGTSFEEIADILEHEPEQYFTKEA